MNWKSIDIQCLNKRTHRKGLQNRKLCKPFIVKDRIPPDGTFRPIFSQKREWKLTNTFADVIMRVIGNASGGMENIGRSSRGNKNQESKLPVWYDQNAQGVKMSVL